MGESASNGVCQIDITSSTWLRTIRPRHNHEGALWSLTCWGKRTGSARRLPLFRISPRMARKPLMSAAPVPLSPGEARCPSLLGCPSGPPTGTEPCHLRLQPLYSATHAARTAGPPQATATPSVSPAVAAPVQRRRCAARAAGQRTYCNEQQASRRLRLCPQACKRCSLSRYVSESLAARCVCSTSRLPRARDVAPTTRTTRARADVRSCMTRVHAR